MQLVCRFLKAPCARHSYVRVTSNAFERDKQSQARIAEDVQDLTARPFLPLPPLENHYYMLPSSQSVKRGWSEFEDGPELYPEAAQAEIEPIPHAKRARLGMRGTLQTRPSLPRKAKRNVRR